MSNQAFAEYATGVAFAITLSKAQCHVLLRVKRAASWDHHCFHVGMARGVAARGLIVSLTKAERDAFVADQDKRERAAKKRGESYQRTQTPIYKLTRAGYLVSELLAEAGITLATSHTLATKRAEAFWDKGDNRRTTPV